jgi:hypothetical protein
MPVRARWAPIARESIVVLMYVGLTAIATYPLVTALTSTIPAGGDIWVYYWDLWWVKRALIDLHRFPFFTPDLYFPFGASLYFHVLNLTQSVIALPVVVTMGLTVAYNFLILLAFTLTGYGTYRLSLYVIAHEIDFEGARRQPSRARLAAFAAGVAFTFSSYRFAHLLGHLDLVSTEWLPIAVLFLLKSRDDERWRHPVLAGVLIAAAALTSTYYLLFLLLFSGVLVAYTMASQGSRAWPVLIRVAVALDVFAVILFPVVVRMLMLGRPEGQTIELPVAADAYSADVLAFFIPSLVHPLAGPHLTRLYASMFGTAASSEHVVFLGYVPIILAAVAVRRLGMRRQIFWIVSFLLFLLLALGPVAHIGGRVVPLLSRLMPYHAVWRLPYGDTPRVPARFVVTGLLCLSLLSGNGIWALLDARTIRPGVIAVATLCALMLTENAAAPIPLEPTAVPAFFAHVAHDPPTGGMLEVPIPDDPSSLPVRMLFQTVHGKPIYQGIVARSRPPLDFDAIPGFRQFKSLSPVVDDVVEYGTQLPATSRTALIAFNAGRVVIEKSLMPDAGAVARARAVAVGLFAAAAVQYEDQETVAYSVPRDMERASTVMWLAPGWSYLEHTEAPGPEKAPLRWRWMGDRARVVVFADHAMDVRLKITAGAFERARHVRIRLGDAQIAAISIAQDRADYVSADFRVPEGFSTIEFASEEAATTAGPDPRRLSIALFRISLLETPSPP